ncbi:MAG: tRNA-dihydrouridine synthase, partial [Polyangiaceae bacterium]
AKAREVVSIPVIVNGDVDGAEAASRALAETGCRGVMVGRTAIDHPWVFREIAARLAGADEIAPPTRAERLDMCREHLVANVAGRGEQHGVRVTRRHLSGYLHGLDGAAAMRRILNQCDTLEACMDVLAGTSERAA